MKDKDMPEDKEPVERHIQAMVDEAVKLGDFDRLDQTNIQVLRRHIAVLECQQAESRKIMRAISEALGELWWVSGTDAKLKIRVVEVLVKKIREA
jgi:hypothetical protein